MANGETGKQLILAILAGGPMSFDAAYREYVRRVGMGSDPTGGTGFASLVIDMIAERTLGYESNPPNSPTATITRIWAA